MAPCSINLEGAGPGGFSKWSIENVPDGEIAILNDTPVGPILAEMRVDTTQKRTLWTQIPGEEKLQISPYNHEDGKEGNEVLVFREKTFHVGKGIYWARIFGW